MGLVLGCLERRSCVTVLVEYFALVDTHEPVESDNQYQSEDEYNVVCICT